MKAFWKAPGGKTQKWSRNLISSSSETEWIFTVIKVTSCTTYSTDGNSLSPSFPDIEILKDLIRGNPNCTDKEGNTVLHWLFKRFGNEFLKPASNLTEFILEDDGDPNLTNMDGYRPLHIACLSQQKQAIKFAVQWNNKIEDMRKKVESSNGVRMSLRIPKEFNFNLETEKRGSETPLHMACTIPSLAMILDITSNRDSNPLVVDDCLRAPARCVPNTHLTSKKLIRGFERFKLEKHFRPLCQKRQSAFQSVTFEKSSYSRLEADESVLEEDEDFTLRNDISMKTFKKKVGPSGDNSSFQMLPKNPDVPTVMNQSLRKPKIADSRRGSAVKPLLGKNVFSGNTSLIQSQKIRNV